MKKNKSLFIMGAALLLLAGCTADEFSEHDGQVPVRLSVSQEATVTRAADGLYTALTGFDGGESVKVYVNSTSKSADYTVSTTDKKTLGGSTLYYPTSNDVKLFAVYPSASTSSHTVKYDQTSADNYKLSDLMYAKKTVTQDDKEETQNLEFSHQLVKLKVIIKKSSDVGSVTQVVMNKVKRKATVSLTTSALTLSNLTSDTDGNGDNILVFSGTNSSTTAQTYAVVFPKQNWSNSDFITVTADGKTATYKLTKDNFVAGSVYTITLNINAAALNNTVSITNWTGNESSVVVNPTVETPLPDRTPSGVVAVDLGLPSGTKWANMNIGATTVTGYGLYYAWGDIVGRSGDNNILANDNYSYNLTNYKWYKDGSGSSIRLTKYVPTAKTSNWGGSGSPDNKLKLEFCDDAAYASWGGAWRMPTKAECQELLDNTTISWTTNYNGTGVAGYTFTGNGNTIFIPTSGDRLDDVVYGQGEYASYWTSTLNTSNPIQATRLFLPPGGSPFLEDFNDRYCGYTVRAVQ